MRIQTRKGIATGLVTLVLCSLPIIGMAVVPSEADMWKWYDKAIIFLSGTVMTLGYAIVCFCIAFYLVNDDQ
jgi:hypothetical protein